LLFTAVTDASTEIQKIFHDEMETILVLIIITTLLLMFVPMAQDYAEVLLAVVGFVILLQVLIAVGVINEVKEYERLAVFRLGHFHRIAGPGWIVIIPFFETAIKMDLRVQKMDIPPQEVITADEIRVSIDMIVYYKIKEPQKAVLAVRDFEDTVMGYVYAALRDIASNLTLNELYSEVEKVNDVVKVKIEPMTAEWGVTVVDVEVQHVRIPEPIQNAMHYRRTAKEEWAAAQSQARAQRTLIEAVAEAASKLDDKALQYLYIKEALPELAKGESTKIVFPLKFPSLPEGVDKGSEEAASLHLSGLMGDSNLAIKKKKKKEE
jgi:regulator of protease activity HflC (stomatin/prohibitin superfamily)